MFKFHLAVTRHAGAAAENVPKIIRALIKNGYIFDTPRAKKRRDRVELGSPFVVVHIRPYDYAGCEFCCPAVGSLVDTVLATCVALCVCGERAYLPRSGLKGDWAWASVSPQPIALSNT